MMATSEMDSLDSFVLITTSVYVRDPGFQGTDRELDAITQKLESRLSNALRDMEEVQMVGSWCYDHVGQEEFNARRCDLCRKWATNHHEKYLIPTLEWGSITPDGRFQCLQCQELLD